jgi:hypothetical protein
MHYNNIMLSFFQNNFNVNTFFKTISLHNIAMFFNDIEEILFHNN